MTNELLGTDIDRYSLVLVDSGVPSSSSSPSSSTTGMGYNHTAYPVNMSGTLQGEAGQRPRICQHGVFDAFYTSLLHGTAAPSPHFDRLPTSVILSLPQVDFVECTQISTSR